LKIIGLTGGIASGKSTVAKRLSAFGAIIVDADKIAREITNTKKVISELSCEFGEIILNFDGSLNRKMRLRKILCKSV
jgi:dephospho-CoA kinase